MYRLILLKEFETHLLETMKSKNVGSILTKTAKKENETSLLDKSIANYSEEVSIKAFQNKFAEEKLNYVEISNILFMLSLRNKQ